LFQLSEVEFAEMTSRRHRSDRSQILEAADHIGQLLRIAGGISKPRLAIILGSGLGEIANSLEAKRYIPFSSIPHFPSPSVEGYSGMLVLGKSNGVSVWCMQGRIHYYESNDMRAVTFPVRVLGLLGVDRLVVTNAAGGIKTSFRAGDLMLIRDHIGLFLQNPLLGTNLNELGPRFPDMSGCYSKSLRALALKCARQLRLALKEGVYAGLSGPSYETPAEIRMLKKMGADAVGMSTVPEVIVARHMGMQCLGISCITNLAAGISKSSLDHEEVLSISQRAIPRLTLLLNSLCREMLKLS
jgi:purine-nucleoside phosphorylase